MLTLADTVVTHCLHFADTECPHHRLHARSRVKQVFRASRCTSCVCDSAHDLEPFLWQWNRFLLQE